MPEGAPTTFFVVRGHRCLESDGSGCLHHHLSVEPARLSEVFENLDVDFHWVPGTGRAGAASRRLGEEVGIDKEASLPVSWGANFNGSRSPPVLKRSVELGPVTCVNCYAGVRLVDLRVKISIQKMILRQILVNATVPVEFGVSLRLKAKQLRNQLVERVDTLAEHDFPKITLADTLDLTPTVSLDIANALLRDIGGESFENLNLPDMYVRLKEPAVVGFGISYEHGSDHPVRTRLEMPETILDHNLHKFTWQSLKEVGQEVAKNASLVDFALKWLLEPMVMVGLDVAGLTDVGVAMQVPVPLGANSTLNLEGALQRRLGQARPPPQDVGGRRSVSSMAWRPDAGWGGEWPRRLKQAPDSLDYFVQGNAPVAHAGEDCWEHCGGRAGFCSWCGWAGVCCKKGEASDPKECNTAIGFQTDWNPFHKHHQCVQATSLTSDLRNRLLRRSSLQVQALERPKSSTYWRVCFKFATLQGVDAFRGKSIQLVVGHPHTSAWASDTRPAERAEAGLQLCGCTEHLSLNQLLSGGPLRFRVLEDNLAEDLQEQNDGEQFSNGLQKLEEVSGSGGRGAQTAGETVDLLSELTGALQPVLQETSVDFRPELMRALAAGGEPEERVLRRKDGQVQILLRLHPVGTGEEEAERWGTDGFVGVGTRAVATLRVLQNAARAAMGLKEREGACLAELGAANAKNRSGTAAEASQRRRLTGNSGSEVGTYAGYSLDMALVWRGIHIGRQWVNDAVDLAGRLVVKLSTGSTGPVMKVFNGFWKVSVKWFTGKIGLAGAWSHEVVPRVEYDRAVTEPEVWSAPVDPNHPDGTLTSRMTAILIAIVVAVMGGCIACCCCGGPAAALFLGYKKLNPAG